MKTSNQSVTLAVGPHDGYPAGLVDRQRDIAQYGGAVFVPPRYRAAVQGEHHGGAGQTDPEWRWKLEVKGLVLSDALHVLRQSQPALVELLQRE